MEPTKNPISPQFRPTVKPASANVCCLGPLSLSPPLNLTHPILDLWHTVFPHTKRTHTHQDMHARTHTCRCSPSYRCTHAHLGQRRGSGRDRELWVTDLAKVAYVAWPNQENPIQQPPRPWGTRERGSEQHEKDSRVCILLKRLPCQVNTSQEWERMRNRGVWVSFSPEIKDERRRKEVKTLKGK